MRRLMGRALLLFTWAAFIGAGGQTAQAEDEKDELLQLLKEAAAAREVQQAAAVEPEPPKKYRLAYKFQPNQFAHFDTWQTMRIHAQYGEADETTINESRTRQHYRVVAVDAEGNAILELTIARIYMTVQFGENPPTICDSTRPEAECPPQFRKVLNTVGKPRARMKFAPTGELLSVTAMIRDLNDEEGQPADAQGAEGRYNFLVVFPEEPVAVGDKWRDSYDVLISVDKSLRRPIKLQRQYTLAKVENGLATIGLKTAVLTPVPDPEQMAKLIQRTPRGTIVFDIERGTIVSRTTEIDERVLGFAGAKSSLQAQGRGVEQRLTDKALADERAFFQLGAD